jgi:hypothetical protein
VTIDVYLNQLLTAGTPPTSLGSALYPVLAPPNTTGRYCVYQLVDQTPILTQEGDPEGTRVWRYQFKVFGPSFALVAADTASLRNFLVGYSDALRGPGIQRVVPLNTGDLPPSSPGRIFCRFLDVQITENLS